MKRRDPAKIVFSLFLILALGLSGCWNRRELDTLAIVSGVALDKATEASQVQLTAQILKPGEIKSTSKSGGQTGGGNPYFNLTQTGTTDFATIRKMADTSSRRLFWAHNQVIIVSQDLAREGVTKYLDLFIRDPELRLLVFILVAQGRAEDILKTKADLEKVPSLEIAKIMRDVVSSSFAPQITLKKFTERLLSKTTSPIAPLISLKGEGQEKKVSVEGTAVFKRDKLVGQLNAYETRGLLWVLGEVKSGIIEVDCGEGQEKAGLEIVRADKKILPQMKDGKISITVKIREEGALAEQMCSENYTKLPAWTTLEEKQTAAIENEVRSALKKAQQLNTDIFGFGDAVHQKYPRLWKEIEPKWDEVFPTLEINVAIEAILSRSGRAAKPAYPQEEQ